MKALLSLYKPIGITPLQLIEQLREAKPEYRHEKIGYAGRLDPMAHGVMLLMIGEETKNRANYLSFPKAYTFTVLFGVQTDTHDILGLLKGIRVKALPTNVNNIVSIFVNNKIGAHIQPFPHFSSKGAKGKPLFWWARNNRLNEIEIPTHQVTITKFVNISFSSIERGELEKKITTNISLVKGDFRQAEILERWKRFFLENRNETFPLATFTLQCSSGTYVRTIADELGKKLGCGAITLDILRIKLGDYELEKTLRL
ncbi:MAG: hypothetical protein ACR2LN_01155 [Candidatus Levyibacteriota bacterium]